MNYFYGSDGKTYTEDVFGYPFESGQDYIWLELKNNGGFVYVPEYLIYDYLDIYNDSDLYDYLDSEFKDWGEETCYPDYEAPQGIK